MPYTSYQKLANGLYNYSSYFNVVDTIETQLDNAANFATDTAGAAGLNIAEHAGKFPQNITAADILNGRNKF